MKISLRNEYFVAILSDDKNLLFSNYQLFENISPDGLIPDAFISSGVKDYNSDGINDEFNIDISFGNDADTI
jgi:hypothetical protein